MPESSSPFVIRELSGRKRKLTLQDRAMPYRPISFTGTMRAEFTWYPGNPQASAQILGSSEGETSIGGTWKDRFIVNPATSDVLDSTFVPSALLNDLALAKAMDVVNVMDSIRREGQLVEVTWDQYIRRGFLLEFTSRPQRSQDVEWEAKFGWISQGDEEVAPTFSFGLAASDAGATWRKRIDGILDKARGYAGWFFEKPEIAIAAANEVLSFSEDFNDLALSALQQLQSVNTAIEDTVDRAIAVGQQTADMGRKFIAILEDARGYARNLIETVESTTTSEYGVFTTPTVTQGTRATGPAPALPSGTVGETVAAVIYARGLARDAREIERNAARDQFEFAKQIVPDPLDVFVSRQDQDARDVSTRYFGTLEEWQRIVEFNGLETSKLEAGTVIFVPRKVS